MKVSILSCAAFAAFAVLAPKQALAQPPTVYTICVGQYQGNCPICNVNVGPHVKCTGYDGYYGCAYAVNPLLQVHAFCNGKGSNPVSWRTMNINGNQCGYSVIGITCN